MMPPANKAILITGATGGLGSAMARVLSAAGYSIIVGYRSSRTKAEALVESLAGVDNGALGHSLIECRVDDTRSLQQVAEYIAAEYGGLHGLVNNAGATTFVPHSDLLSLTDDIIDGIFQVHVRGALAALRECSRLLTPGSCVINITSIAAETGMGSNIAYCAAKAAMSTATLSLARALAPQTRVLAVAPGLVDTDFVQGMDPSWRAKQERATPLGRLAEPLEIAQAVLSCFRDLSFSTGRVVHVDGGRNL